jgi:D-alanyl-D-alanine carboxypeptidase
MGNSNRHGFNTVFNSQLPKRERRSVQKRVAIVACCIILALMLVLSLALVIHHFVTNAPPAPAGPNNESDTSTPSTNESTVRYEDTSVTAADLQFGSLLLVNANNHYTVPTTTSHLSDIASVMSAVGGYSTAGISNKMETNALNALARMLSDHHAANLSVTIMMRYAYPTETATSTDDELYTGLTTELRIKADANGRSNQPLNFDATTEAWFKGNAHKYGFVLRYPSDKAEQTGVPAGNQADYFRYVGVAHATYMYQNNLCLEEYIALLKDQHTATGPLTVTGADGNRYEIFYVAITDDSDSDSATIPCPTNYAYTLSGTNENGMVVTVNLSDPS